MKGKNSRKEVERKNCLYWEKAVIFEKVCCEFERKKKLEK